MNVAETITDSVIDGMRHLGQERGLEPLDWWVVVVDECPIIEGAPFDGADIDVCRVWAEALCMREYTFDDGDGERSWYTYNGVWEVELSTRSR